MISAIINKVVSLHSLDEVIDIINRYGTQNLKVNDDDWPAEDILVRKINIKSIAESINQFTTNPENIIPFLYH